MGSSVKLSRLHMLAMLRVACGRSEAAIARDLRLHPGAVSRLLDEAGRRLGAPTPAATVRRAVAAGLITFRPMGVGLPELFPDSQADDDWDGFATVPASGVQRTYWLTDPYGQRVPLRVDPHCLPLTELEFRVVLRLATAESATSVAAAYGHKECWVRDTLKRVFRKLDARTLPEALMKLMVLGYLTTGYGESVGS